MKVSVLILIALSLMSAGCSRLGQTVGESTAYMEVLSTDSRLHNQDRLLKYEGLLFTGKVIKLYAREESNSNISLSADTASISEYVNGRLNGKQLLYYPGGRLYEERYYENGSKNGEHKGWWENGNQKFIYNFKNDEFDGNVRMWNESGMLFNDFNYSNGREEGLQRSWFESGDLRANYVAKNNRKYGLTGVKNCKTEIK